MGCEPRPDIVLIKEDLLLLIFCFLLLFLILILKPPNALSSPKTMDPLTLSMAITPLILTSARLAILVTVVRDSYTDAPTTLLSTLAECHLMHTALQDTRLGFQKRD